MKKLMALLTVLCISASFAVPSFAAVSYEPLLMENFNGYSETTNVFQTLSANSWLFNKVESSYSNGDATGLSIVDMNGSKKLKLWGTNYSAKYFNPTGASLLSKNFNYTLTSYPNSKLVISREMSVYINTDPKATSPYVASSLPLIYDSSSRELVKGYLSRVGIVTYTSSRAYATADITAMLNNHSDMEFVEVIDLSAGKFRGYLNDTYSYESNITAADIGKMTLISGTNGSDVYFDNVKVYPVSTIFELVDSPQNGASNLSVKSEITAQFNNSLSASALTKILVKAGGITVDPSLYTIEKVTNTNGLDTILKIKFKNGMNYGTNYTVEFPSDFYDVARTAITAPAAISFTTEIAPSFDVTCTFKSGYQGTGAEVTKLSQIAGNDLQCSASVSNTSGKAVNGVIFVGLYKNGKIIGGSYLEKSFANQENGVIKCSLPIPKDVTGLELKVFACDNTSNLYECSTVTTLPSN